MTPERSSENGHGPATEDRLDSWKEIASYLKKGVRTVQRWEQNEGLPVRRLSTDRRGMVFAYRSEIDAWWSSRGSSLLDSPETEESETSHGPSPGTTAGGDEGRWWIASAAAAVLVGAGLTVWHLSGPVAFPDDASALLASTPLTSATGVEQHPAFSADGRRLAYSSNPDGLMGFDIYARPVQGDEEARLTRHPAPDFHPAWSPDGGRIAFVRIDHSGSDSGVYIVPSAGGAETKAAAMGIDMPFAYLVDLAWTRDGQGLYFSKPIEGDRRGIGLGILDVATGTSELLAERPGARYDIAPRVSPDGSRVAFLRAYTKTYPSAIIVQPVGRNGRATGEEAVIETGGEMISLDWTPDGRELVYVGRAGGDWALWRIDAKRAHPPRRLSGPGLNVTGIAVSPANGLLVYETEQADSNIWRLDTASGNYHELIVSTYADRDPSYSVDGARIAFLSSRSGAEQVWVSSDGGNAPFPVTSFETGVLSSPTWTPDNQHVVFSRATGDRSELWLADVEMRSAKRIVSEEGTLGCPFVSRDGAWLFFSSDRDGQARIWRTPLQGGSEPEPVSREHGRYVMQAPDGRHLYYATHDGDGLVRRFDLETLADEAVRPALPMGAGLAAGNDGFYWMPLREPGEPIDIRFRTYDGAEERLLARIPKLIQPGLAVSPDGRWVLYTQMDQFGSDLHLVEDFR